MITKNHEGVVPKFTNLILEEWKCSWGNFEWRNVCIKVM